MTVKTFNTATLRSDEWLTPPEIIRSLGEFDLDPCSPIKRPWDTAKKHYTIEDDGLLLPWEGRVWMNPPYSELKDWLNKIALHGCGIALTFAKTETVAFQEFVFPMAESIFYIKKRLNFYDASGKRAKHNSGAPSVLISYSEADGEALARSGLTGFHSALNSPYIIIIERTESTWKLIIDNAVKNLNGEAMLQQIYDEVLKLAPKKVARNRHYKEKVRQVLQSYFNRVEKGKYSLSIN